MATELVPLHASPVIGDTTAQTTRQLLVLSASLGLSQPQQIQLHALHVLLARYLEIISVL